MAPAGQPEKPDDDATPTPQGWKPKNNNEVIKNAITNEQPDRMRWLLEHLPDIRQPNHWTCGAAAATGVGLLYGVGPKDIEGWVSLLGTTEQDSTRPQAIIEAFGSFNCPVQARQGMTIADLTGYVQQGVPVIVCVQDYASEQSPKASFDYGHYLTVCGVIPGFIICQDSSIENAESVAGGDVTTPTAEEPLQANGKVLIGEQEFLSAWHDQDVDGNKLDRFGIAVFPPSPVTSSVTRNAQTKQQKREKYRALVEDAACRAITKERNAIARIAKNNLPNDIPTFEQNTIDFWEEHGSIVSNTFHPVVSTYSQKNCDRILSKIVKSMMSESLDALANAVQSPSPLEAVTGVLGGWGQMRHIRVGDKFCRGHYER
jgi:hypothetical protein